MRPNIPPAEFVDWLRSLSREELERGRRIELETAKKDYEAFKGAFEAGRCSLCDRPLASFSAQHPCLHWLLRPKGFKKKHLPDLYSAFGYFRTAAYVRWVASTEAPGKNINDLVDEHGGGKVIDFTARWRHITWSFSCAPSDLKGHGTTDLPHFHFQMTLDGKRFIAYNDFHVPFTSDDLYDLELFTNHADFVKHGWGPGFGMRDVLGDDDAAQMVVDHSVPTEDEKNAAFRLQTLVMAEPGKTISGSVLYEAIQEAKRTGRTMASVVKDKIKDAKVVTVVSPGDGVVPAKPRSGRR